MPKTIKKVQRKLYYPYKNYRRALATIKLLAEKESLSINKIAELTGSDSFYVGAKHLVERLIKLGYCNEFGIISNKNHSCKHCKKKKSKRFLARVEDLHPLPEWKPLQKDKELEEFTPKKESHIKRSIWVECLRCQKKFLSSKEIKYTIYPDRIIKLSENGRFVVLVFLENNLFRKFISKYRKTLYMDLIYALMRSQKKAEVKILLEKIKNSVHEDPDVMSIVHNWHSKIRKKVMSARNFLKIEQPLFKYQKNQRLGNFKFKK